jgi:hypothetical protein
MGVASYNRGTARLIAQIDASARLPEFQMMDDLNAMPKDAGANKPFGPIHFIAGHGGFWAACPVTGFGYWYRTLRQAVRAWRVTIVAYSNNAWIGEVQP